jgi:two-component system phosphate regulon sensor histidine kinase PhoR
MTARIFFKLIAAFLLIMVVALTAIDFVASNMSEQSYVEGLKREMSQKMRMLAVMSAEDIRTLPREKLKAIAKAAGGRITVIAPDGSVLQDSEAEPSRMENHGNRPEVQAALRGEIGTATRHSETVGVNFLYVAVPVGVGSARLAVPLVEISDRIYQMRKNLVVYTLLAFLPAILLAAFFARYFSRRLGAIIDYASQLAKGNFQVRLEKTGKDELGVLGSQLNETGLKLKGMFEELEKEHAELEKLERIRKDFVINVSHELRTPLASIQGYTETLLDGAIEDPQNNMRFLHIIRQNAERLGRLTQDLLTLSRIELKTQRFQFAAYYVNPLLSECLDSIAPVAAKKNITLTFEAAPEKTEIFGDNEAIHQIMSNLLDNAIKYTPHSGAVRIFTRILPSLAGGGADMVEISVQDTGIGIPEEDLPRLFERFYRVDKARSRELGGTGLGLAIVKHLVRSQGGEVGVESDPSRGSRFWFTLPVEDMGLPEHWVQQDVTMA